MTRELTARLLAYVFICALSLASRAQAQSPPLAQAAGKVTQLIAHRGASAERPECTLAAIERAIEVGATAVEIDIRTSRDGQLFILHDATLDRTTNGEGPANKLTLAELKALDAGSWFSEKFRGERIPSFVEAAKVCRGRIDLLLDLKEQGDRYDRQVVQVIETHGDARRTIVGVRSVEQAKRFRMLLPQTRQLALIPSVDQIEAFAEAGVDVIRLWPRWLQAGDSPAKRIRAVGKKLHLNGTLGQLAETRALLAYAPDSLSSDDPRRLKQTLRRIVEGDLPDKRLAQLVEVEVEQAAVPTLISESSLGSRTFLNRNYVMQKIPVELNDAPRLMFDGGQGNHLSLRFKQNAVMFVVFGYNDSGAWSFADGSGPDERGWHLWRKQSYRGTSNGLRNDKPHHADVWFREFKSGQVVKDLPPWWLCLGITDLETAKTLKGFQAGLTAKRTVAAKRFSHQMEAGRIQPLNVPKFSSREEFQAWQDRKRQQFLNRMLFPYAAQTRVAAGEVGKTDGLLRQEFQVLLGDRRLFRYFRIVSSAKSKSPRPTVVCFMGHGKVEQILSERDSYQHACAAQFAEAGYLVYAMENVGMEPHRDDHLDLDRTLRLEGRGWYHLLFAHQRILLNHVFEDPEVDVKRVGAAGVSTGGLLALSAAAMEPRIAATSVQGIFGSMRVSFIQDRNRHCGCGAIPGLLPDFDLPELALLVAPRRMHICNPQQDGFSPSEAKRCIRLIAPLVTLSGGQQPTFSSPPGGHAFAFGPAAEFFRQALR